MFASRMRADPQRGSIGGQWPTPTAGNCRQCANEIQDIIDGQQAVISPAGSGDGVDDAQDEGAFVVVEADEVGELVSEGVLGAVKWPSGCGLDEQAVGSAAMRLASSA